MSFNECACSGSTLDRFVRPSVMAVLARNPCGSHGYLLAQQLREVAVFADCSPDTTGLYRVLKAVGEYPGALCVESWADTRIYRAESEQGPGSRIEWCNLRARAVARASEQ